MGPPIKFCSYVTGISLCPQAVSLAWPDPIPSARRAWSYLFRPSETTREVFSPPECRGLLRSGERKDQREISPTGRRRGRV